jgi:hypothetical protein
MTKLEELKAAAMAELDAAYAARRVADAAVDAAIDAAWNARNAAWDAVEDALDAALDAYEAEQKKTQEENSND